MLLEYRNSAIMIEMKEQPFKQAIGRHLSLFLLLFTIGSFCVNPVLFAQPAPGFWISNLAGERFDSRKHEGSIIISFFEVNCIPCKTEIPQLYDLITKKKLNTALLFIDPSETDSKEAIRAFVGRRGVPAGFFYHDALGRLSRKFFEGVFVFPTIVGIKNNQVVFRTNELDDKAINTISSLFQ